jgi:hypothetical protein
MVSFPPFMYLSYLSKSILVLCNIVFLVDSIKDMEGEKRVEIPNLIDISPLTLKFGNIVNMEGPLSKPIGEV